MNFKEIFLKLIEYTTPYGEEHELEPILTHLVPNIKKDLIGNYHYIIGKSETLFTCHLDNYCKEKNKVNYIIEDNFITSDGNTILGADNKAGVCVLLYLISRNVPGHYCFFIGEEPILSGGCYGSSLFAARYKSINKYKRAIAFDRKGEGSIITRQMAQYCCSDEFADELVLRFFNENTYMFKDNTGYYTDTSSFLEKIPECTNISIGVYDEHTNQEFVDLEYLEKIAVAAANINWETLPSCREPKPWVEDELILEENGDDSDYMLFKLLSSKLSNFNFLCMNNYPFNKNKVMVFNNWFEDFRLNITVRNSVIMVNNHELRIDYAELITIEQLKNIIILCNQDLINEYQ